MFVLSSRSGSFGLFPLCDVLLRSEAFFSVACYLGLEIAPTSQVASLKTAGIEFSVSPPPPPISPSFRTNILFAYRSQQRD